MKIILTIFVILILLPTKAFSLTYDKRVNTDIIFQDGTKGGKSETEGFWSDGNQFFPSCKRMNVNLFGLRQGLRVFYKPDGSIHSSENGLYDCQVSFGRTAFGIVEGVAELPNFVTVHYKRDSTTRYYYSKQNNIWYFSTANVDVAYTNDPNSNYKTRPATTEEINHAERLYKFYKEIDLSSPKAKKYTVLNTSIHLNESKKTQEQAPTKKQNESGVAAELERLQKLLNSGAITKDEYQKAKNKVLK